VHYKKEPQGERKLASARLRTSSRASAEGQEENLDETDRSNVTAFSSKSRKGGGTSAAKKYNYFCTWGTNSRAKGESLRKSSIVWRKNQKKNSAANISASQGRVARARRASKKERKGEGGQQPFEKIAYHPKGA